MFQYVHLSKIVAFSTLVISTISHADEPISSQIDEIIVKDSPLVLPSSTENTSKIDLEDTSQIKRSSVSEYIDEMSGVDSSNNGSLGVPPTISVRGSSSEHLKILLDGIDISDPTFSTRLSSFTLINTSSLSDIEISKGSNAVSYGPGALGGTLNFKSKQGKGPLKITPSLEVGSYETLNKSAVLSKGTDSHNIYIELSKLDSEGISSASSEYGNHEKDSTHTFNTMGNFGYSFSDDINSSIIFKHGTNMSDLDLLGGENGDDPNYTSNTTHNLIIGKTRSLLFSERLDQESTVAIFTTKRSLSNEIDSLHPDNFLKEMYEGKRLTFSFKNAVSISSKYTLVVSGDSTQDSATISSESISHDISYSELFNKKSSISGLSLMNVFQPLKQMFLKIGFRQDFFHSINKNLHLLHQRYEASWQQSEDEPKFFAGYGVSYNCPTLYQLYSTYGQERLRPEESKSYDFGVVFSPNNSRLKLSLSYFDTLTANLIDFDFSVMRYYNLGKIKIKGIESQIETNISDKVTTTFSYTQTDAHNGLTDERLLRRPLHKYTSKLSYQPSKSTFFSTSGIFVRERKDLIFSDAMVKKVTLKPYSLIQTGAKYILSDTSSIYLRIENLFDAIYEEVAGFGTYRRSYFAGAEFSL